MLAFLEKLRQWLAYGHPLSLRPEERLVWMVIEMECQLRRKGRSSRKDKARALREASEYLRVWADVLSETQEAEKSAER